MGDTYLVVDGTVYDLVPREPEPLDKKPSVAQTREQSGDEDFTPKERMPGDDPTWCPMHNVPMKKRMKKDGGFWYDHREQQNEVWVKCSGKGFK